MRITPHQTGGKISVHFIWEVDIRLYFLCVVDVQVRVSVFLGDVDNNPRGCPSPSPSTSKFEKYDGEAGSEDVVITFKVVLYTYKQGKC